MRKDKNSNLVKKLVRAALISRSEAVEDLKKGEIVSRIYRHKGEIVKRKGNDGLIIKKHDNGSN